MKVLLPGPMKFKFSMKSESNVVKRSVSYRHNKLFLLPSILH